MKDALIIFFGIIYLLSGLYLSFTSRQAATRMLKGNKIVSKKEKKVYIVFLASLVGIILSVIL